MEKCAVMFWKYHVHKIFIMLLYNLNQLDVTTHLKKFIKLGNTILIATNCFVLLNLNK